MSKIIVAALAAVSFAALPVAARAEAPTMDELNYLLVNTAVLQFCQVELDQPTQDLLFGTIAKDQAALGVSDADLQSAIDTYKTNVTAGAPKCDDGQPEITEARHMLEILKG